MVLASCGRQYLIFLHILWVFNKMLLVECDWLMDCGDCHCKWNSGKKTADCRNLSLASIPENLNSELQVLDISFNRIAYLEENAFFSAQLQNLHKLFIRNCSVQIIHLNSFNSLEILVELDLSNNLLRTLDANVFSRLCKIRSLILNGNLLKYVSNGTFQDLKYLHKIELKNNCITDIDIKAFINVPLLTKIYLAGNKLSTLRKETFVALKALNSLLLDYNPWNCTCELQVFRDFVLSRHLYTPSISCYYPIQLRGVLWLDKNTKPFACKPRIIYPTRGSSISTSKENVTLICRIHASPKTLIAWNYKKKMFLDNATRGSRHRLYIQMLRDDQLKKELGLVVFISRLNIIHAEKSDGGIYTCFARNAGGEDGVQMKLLIQKPEQRMLFLHNNIILMISLMVLVLICASVFPVMITYYTYRHFKNTKLQSHQHLKMSRTMIILENRIVTTSVPFNEN